MRYYALLQNASPVRSLERCTATSREGAWTEARLVLKRPGDQILQIEPKWYDWYLDCYVSGQRVMDSAGFHVIGCVVAYMNDKNVVRFLDPVNGDA